MTRSLTHLSGFLLALGAVCFLADAAWAQAYEIQDYAKECREKVGPVPPFSCITGVPANIGNNLPTTLKALAAKVRKPQIIPIKKDGNTIAAASIDENTKCDRPKYLDGGAGHCQPNARIGRLPGANANGDQDDDVAWTFICRRYRVEPDENDPHFEDVAIVGSRRSTGATCFYQMLDQDSPKDTTRVPSPLETAAETPPGHLKASQFWLTPQATANIRCNACHNPDPWIHTPYVDQVCLRKEGSEDCQKENFKDIPIVPHGPQKPNLETGYYHFVGTQFFTSWTAPRYVEIDANADGAIDANKCLDCHRIGVQAYTSGQTFNYCERILAGSVGRDIAFLNLFASNLHKRPDHARWMPEGMPGIQPDGPLPEPQWLAAYDALAPAAGITALLDCCKNPNQPKCKVKNVPPKP